MSNYLGFEPTKRPSFYFVSYNNEDADLVMRFAKPLHHANLPLWYDYGLAYGEKWEEQITERINSSQGVLLLFTNGILKKDNSYVKREYDLAKHLKKKIYVVFVDRVDEDNIPLSKLSWWLDIKENQCLDVSGVFDKALEMILEAMGLATNEDQMNSLIKQYQELFEEGKIKEADDFLNQYLFDKSIEAKATLFADMLNNKKKIDIDSDTKYKGIFDPPLEWRGGVEIKDTICHYAKRIKIKEDTFTILDDYVFHRGTRGDACIAGLFRNSECIYVIGGLIESGEIGLYYDEIDNILFAYTFSDYEVSDNDDDNESLLTVVAVNDPINEAICYKFQWVNSKRII